MFVIWTHPLFHESVRLLLKHPEVEWVGATSDHAAVRGQIASLHPDTILVEVEEDQHASAETLEILEASSSEIRVIQLGLVDNQLTVYHREHRTVEQPSDLLRLILT